MNEPTPIKLLFLGYEEERNYLPRLKSMVGVATVYLKLTPISTIVEITAWCKAKGVTGVLSTNTTLLSKLLAAAGNPKTKTPSLDNYAGSYFFHDTIEFVFINPLEQLISIPYTSFLTKRFISKLTEPEIWAENITPAFNWCMLEASNEQGIFESYSNAYAIAVDIETFRHNLAIRCIGYTAIFISIAGMVTTHSCVLPIDSSYNLAVMRKFNWELKAPKIFQKGKYDISYLSRYNAVPYNYIWDTANLFHSWYSELPKDLAFLGAFFVRKAMYWKDLAETNDLHEYYRYNALDHWTTALVWMAQMLQLPDWARRNYLQEFPVMYPCHLSEMTGIKRDPVRLIAANKEANEAIHNDNISLSKMVGTYPAIYNVNSAPQNKALRKILGCGDLNSSDEKHLIKIGERHPLNKCITDKILDIRGNRKLTSTYVVVEGIDPETEKERHGKELGGRVLYSISPDTTVSGRCTSDEHHFWCGLQIQNIPRGVLVKQTLCADDGFMLAEADLKQAESRDTGYISGDSNLIAAVNSSKDFHALNASAFFGVPYESVFSDELGKTIDKILRDLAKRTNHGANYLMGAYMLASTMGDANVWRAKKLLALPASFGLLDVTEYLLRQFHKTYPSLEEVFYPAVVHEISTTHMIESHACIYEPDVYDVECTYPTSTEWELEPLVGWARYCFGRPDLKENKRYKNAVVAHVPQNLNAMVLNKAYLRVFYTIAINPKYAAHFKLLAQIHDSILFQFRIGHEYLMEMVQKCMEIPVRVKGYDGVIREFTVPADVKAGPLKLGMKYWSELE